MIKETFVKVFRKMPGTQNYYPDFDYRCGIYRANENEENGMELLQSHGEIARDILGTCEQFHLSLPASLTPERLTTFLHSEDFFDGKVLTENYVDQGEIRIPMSEKDKKEKRKGILYVGKGLALSGKVPMPPLSEEDREKPCAAFFGSIRQHLVCIYEEKFIPEEDVCFVIIKYFKNSFGKIVKKLLFLPFYDPNDATDRYMRYAAEHPVDTETVNVCLFAESIDFVNEDPWFGKEIERIKKKNGIME